MNGERGENRRLIDIYRQRATDYDASGIHGLEPFRGQAVHALNLSRGDKVVDVGCGTGLNFALLEEAVGPEGKIIGVDLTDAMLAQAQRRAAEHNWHNIELVQHDATQYEFPSHVDGIISAFALTFIPDCARVIRSGCQALTPGRKWVVLDMRWPDRIPPWLRHGLFFLASWGITGDVIRRRPWQTVWQTIEQHLVDPELKLFWMGFLYLASGTQPP
jgi:demethylmenaquinone methyltransferase/2-methoxy-6-polyprenyl-1,4-benzoquinol methylase